jgi:hypothetical protein
LVTSALAGSSRRDPAGPSPWLVVAGIAPQVAELLEQAAANDQAQDREHGAGRGAELPRALAGRAERLARLQRAKALLEAAARQQRYQQRVEQLAARGPGPRPATPGPYPAPTAR